MPYSPCVFQTAVKNRELRCAWSHLFRADDLAQCWMPMSNWTFIFFFLSFQTVPSVFMVVYAKHEFETHYYSSITFPQFSFSRARISSIFASFHLFFGGMITQIIWLNFKNSTPSSEFPIPNLKSHITVTLNAVICNSVIFDIPRKLQTLQYFFGPSYNQVTTVQMIQLSTLLFFFCVCKWAFDSA